MSADYVPHFGRKVQQEDRQAPDRAERGGGNHANLHRAGPKGGEVVDHEHQVHHALLQRRGQVRSRNEALPRGLPLQILHHSESKEELKDVINLYIHILIFCEGGE